MRLLFVLITLTVLAICLPAGAFELQPLAACSIKVFREINRSRVWSGKPPDGCSIGIYVEKRPAGIFVTTWNSGSFEEGWERLSLSVAMGFSEIAKSKLLEQAGRDISSRAAHLEKCLDSIIRVNDPLDCRDRATKIYSAGDELGIEYNRNIWLDDNGRHSVVEHAHGDTRASTSSVPADLFGGPALPPGANLNIHFFNND